MAMQGWKQPTEKQSTTMASVYNDMATSYNGMGDAEDYVRYILKALKVITKSKGEINQNVAALYNNLGHSYYFAEKYDSAEYYARKGLRIADKVYGGKANNRSQFSHSDLAKIYIEMGNFTEALKHAEFCYSMATEIYGENNINTARALGILGDVYLAMGDYTNADKYRTRSTHMYEAFFDGPSPMLAWQYWDEADRYHTMGNLKKAIEYNRKCLDMYYKTMPNATEDIAEAKHILAGFLTEADSIKEAIVPLEESLKGYNETVGTQDEKTQSVIRELIDLYQQVGRQRDAQALRVQLNNTNPDSQ